MKQIRLLLTGWSHVTCLMSNANVDPWDMLNNFCFHVYAQKWHMTRCEILWSKMSSCQVVKFDPWDMLNNFCFHVYAQKCQVVKLSRCQVWSLVHAEQLLFPCLFSKVSSCQVVRLCAYHVYSTASNLAIRSQTMLTGIILYYLVT